MEPRKRLCIAAVSLSVFGLSAAASHAALSSPTDARVSFLVSGPVGLKIEGSTGELQVADDGGNVTITIPLGNLTTGISLRDKHMKDSLETTKYPTTTLTVARSVLKVPTSGERVESDASGTLTLHGQTRPVSVHYDTKWDGSTFATHGRVHFVMTDFGITVPSYLGVTVKPDVDVNANFKVTGS
jgi:polyisoprenoid-binding protein YceI